VLAGITELCACFVSSQAFILQSIFFTQGDDFQSRS
jgi:hypothetical protein